MTQQLDRIEVLLLEIKKLLREEQRAPRCRLDHERMKRDWRDAGLEHQSCPECGEFIDIR